MTEVKQTENTALPKTDAAVGSALDEQAASDAEKKDGGGASENSETGKTEDDSSAENGTRNKKKKAIAAVVVSAAVIAVGVLLFFLLRSTPTLRGTPTLTVKTPEKRTYGDTAPFTVDLCLNTLGDELYAAASFSIGFDKSRLEFLGVEEGNVTVLDNGSGEKMPEWSVNAEKSNETGMINIMYLDVTGGKNAFLQTLLSEEDNVVLRLSFRLRGSAKRSDVYETEIKDAVFAATDEKKSLASAKGTLKTQNGKIVVGE